MSVYEPGYGFSSVLCESLQQFSRSPQGLKEYTNWMESNQVIRRKSSPLSPIIRRKPSPLSPLKYSTPPKAMAMKAAKSALEKKPRILRHFPSNPHQRKTKETAQPNPRRRMSMGMGLRKRFPRRSSRSLQVSSRPSRRSLPSGYDQFSHLRTSSNFKVHGTDALRELGAHTSLNNTELSQESCTVKKLQAAIFTNQRKPFVNMIFQSKKARSSSLLSNDAHQQLLNRHVLPNTISPINLVLHLLLSTVLVILYFEIQWIEEMWIPNISLGNGIKALQSIATASLCYQYWKMLRQETAETHSSSWWGYFNLCLLSLHNPPFLTNIPDKMSLVMLYRVFSIGIDVYRITHPYWSQRVAIRQIMSNNTILSRMYIIRAGLIQEPVLLGVTFCFSYNIVVAYAIYVIERENQGGFDFFKAFYYNVIVFTGVGLGDEGVTDGLARVLTAFTAFVGFACMGFIVTGLIGLIKMAESEMEAGQVWELVSLRAALEHTAACIIQRFWRAILSVKKQKEVIRGKSHTRKMRSVSLGHTPSKAGLFARMGRRGSINGKVTQSNAAVVKQRMQTLGSQLTLTQSRLKAVVNKFATPKQQGGISDRVFKKCDLPKQAMERRRNSSISSDLSSQLGTFEKMMRETEIRRDRRQSLPSIADDSDHGRGQDFLETKAFLIKNSLDIPKKSPKPSWLDSAQTLNKDDGRSSQLHSPRRSQSHQGP